MDSTATVSAPVRGDSGFTLIELLVSLTILTVVLGLLSSAMRTLSQNWNANANRLERIEMVARAFDIFERDVSGFQRLILTSGDKKKFIFTGTPDRLSFVTKEPPYPTVPGPYFVDYSIAANGPSFDLIRARAPYTMKMQTFPGATPANSVSLLQGPFKYKFSYSQKGTANDKWAPSWRNKNRLPDLIRLEIIDERGLSVTQPFVAALRTDAELGCLSDDSDTCSAKKGGQLNQIEAQNTAPGMPGK